VESKGGFVLQKSSDITSTDRRRQKRLRGRKGGNMIMRNPVRELSTRTQKNPPPNKRAQPKKIATNLEGQKE